MDVARLAVVAVGAIVDDGGGRQTAAAVRQAAGLVRQADRLRVAHGAVRMETAVAVVATDSLVQVEELRSGDRAVVERLQAVLHRDVIERPACEPGLGVPSVHVHVMLVHVAARPAGIIRRVILQRLRQRVGAELADRDAPGVDRHVRHRLQHEETGDRLLLFRGEAAVARVLEVVVQQPRVGDHRDGAEADVREAAARNDAVEQAGVVVGDLVVLVRPARAAPADGVLRRAVAFHEALLHHHHGLGRQHVVAVVGVDVEAGGGDRVPLAEHDVVGHAARAVTLPEPAVHAAAAEGVDEPPVPAGQGGPGIRFAGRRLVQHRDLVDRTVDGAGLDAHDVRHGRPGQRGSGREIGRPCGRVGEGLQLAVRGSVDVVDAAVDGAVVVERRAQRLAPLQLERLGLADERLLMRAGEHRAFDRVVHERERAPRRAVGACQQQLAGA